MADPSKIRRCAVYTRKSSEEGLDQDFNSLQAQREACEAYIVSQRGEGWRLVPDPYDDGGPSGGTMERPALQRLLADIEAGRIDVVVVYKVDRLTRSLADFSKMVEVFDRKSASFVAVTQHFNTTTSMGRLTLNVLLSFAQFEREVTGERIRDKIAASKRKGLWMGGVLPLGYDVQDRKLIVISDEADAVRQIFRTYLSVSSVRELAMRLRAMGIRSKPRNQQPGCWLSRGALYGMLSNPLYVGDIAHKGNRYPGQHEAIVDRTIWDTAQEKLKGHATYSGSVRKTEQSPLTGKLFDAQGRPLSPSHSNKQGRRYQYYISRPGDEDESASAWRLPAREIEMKVTDVAAAMLRDSAAVAAAAMREGLGAEQTNALLMTLDRGASKSVLDWMERVQLHSDQIVVTVSLRGPTPLRIEHAAPIKVRRRGHQRRLVIPAVTASEPRLDARLIRALKHGLEFWERLLENPSLTAMDIARQEKLDNRYVGRTLPLAFLAPDIVERFLSGRQPPEWTAERVLRLKALPVSWPEQRALFRTE